MRNSYLLHEFTSPPDDQLGEVHKSVKQIQQHLLKELSLKQEIIEKKEDEIQQLQDALEEKLKAIEDLRLQVEEVVRNNEGNKQLNKKLLNELVRKQQDIEWYKRTYETRSLIGTIKQKLIKRFK